MGLIKRTPADAAFSLCVRERASWTCERCGGVPHKQGLHCAHVMSRGNWFTRFDPSNALSLCYGCHVITERQRSLELIPLVISIFGEQEWDRVYADSKRTAKGLRKIEPLIAKHFRKEHERMVALRDSGKVGRIEFEGFSL